MRKLQLPLIALLSLAAFAASYAFTSFATYGDVRFQGTRVQRIGSNLAYALEPYLPIKLIRDTRKRVMYFLHSPHGSAALLQGWRSALHLPTFHISAARSAAPHATTEAFLTASGAGETYVEYGKPTLTPRKMLALAEAHTYETAIANVHAASGGVLRLSDGSYCEIAPGALARDVRITLETSAPALTNSPAYAARSDALLLRFAMPQSGIAYAPSVAKSAPTATVGITLRAVQIMHLRSQRLLAIKRVILNDGTAADFAQTPTLSESLAVADIAADHLLRFTARYHGTIMVSIQHLNDMVVQP